MEEDSDSSTGAIAIFDEGNKQKERGETNSNRVGDGEVDGTFQSSHSGRMSTTTGQISMQTRTKKIDTKTMFDPGVNTSEVRMRKQKSRGYSNRHSKEGPLNCAAFTTIKDDATSVSDLRSNKELNKIMGKRRPSLLSMVTWQDGRSNDAPQPDERVQVSQVITKDPSLEADMTESNPKKHNNDCNRDSLQRFDRGKSESSIRKENRLVLSKTFLSNRVVKNNEDINQDRENHLDSTNLGRSSFEVKQPEKPEQKGNALLDDHEKNPIDGDGAMIIKGSRRQSKDVQSITHKRGFVNKEEDGRSESMEMQHLTKHNSTEVNNSNRRLLGRNERMSKQQVDREQTYPPSQNVRRHTLQHSQMGHAHVDNNTIDHSFRRRNETHAQNYERPTIHESQKNSHYSHDESSRRGGGFGMMRQPSISEIKSEHQARLGRRHTMQLSSTNNAEVSRYLHKTSSLRTNEPSIMQHTPINEGSIERYLGHDNHRDAVNHNHRDTMGHSLQINESTTTFKSRIYDTGFEREEGSMHRNPKQGYRRHTMQHITPQKSSQDPSYSFDRSNRTGSETTITIVQQPYRHKWHPDSHGVDTDMYHDHDEPRAQSRLDHHQSKPTNHRTSSESNRNEDGLTQKDSDPSYDKVSEEPRQNYDVVNEMSPWLEHCRDPIDRRASIASFDTNKGGVYYNPMDDVERFEIEQKEEEKQMMLAKEENLNSAARRESLKSSRDSSIGNAVDEMKNICEQFSEFFNKQEENKHNDGKLKKPADTLTKLERMMSVKHRLPIYPSFPKDLLQIIKLLPGNDKCSDCGVKFNGKHEFGSPTYGNLLCRSCAFRHIDTLQNEEVVTTQIISIQEGEWTLPNMIAMVEGGNRALFDFFQKNDKTKKHRRSSGSLELRHRKKGPLLQPSESDVNVAGNRKKNFQNAGNEKDSLKTDFERVYSSRAMSSYRKILLDRTQWVLLKKVLNTS